MSWDVRTRVAVLLSAVVWIAAAARRPDEGCTSPEYRQLDFAIGNWLVRDGSDRVIGTATITKAYDGCVLIETWQGVGRNHESLGVIGYRSDRGRWHREFLDPDGVVLIFEGELDGASMVLTGTDYPVDGPRMHRVAWSPRSGGAVEERWQTSIDAGRSWQLHFFGVFRRIAE